MDYGMLPPEVNSGRIYAGAGSGSMSRAAAAWDILAAELRSVANSYASTLSTLSAQWRGPSAVRMAAAASPYITWLRDTAARAGQAAVQASVAVHAYQTAFAATVPPAVIAANRSELAALIATNVFGQNAQRSRLPRRSTRRCGLRTRLRCTTMRRRPRLPPGWRRSRPRPLQVSDL